MLFFGFKSSQVTINTLKVINSFLLVFFSLKDYLIKTNDLFIIWRILSLKIEINITVLINVSENTLV